MARHGKLEGKLALVTGSGTGLGREIALDSARQGADVALHYSKSAAGAHSAVEEIRVLGRRALALQADLSEVEACFDLVDKAVEFLGGIDIMMNNAGITASRRFVEVEPQEFDLLYNVNVRAQFFCAQQAVKCMLAQKRKGVVINMTSVHGCSGFVDHSVYDGTKGAIWAWTRELAVELAPLGIRVNGIAPGWIAVESHFRQIRNFDPEALGKRMVPCQQLGKPIQVAKACIYLASEDSDYVVGHVLVIDGGVTAKTSLPLEILDAEWGDASGE